MNQRTQAAQFVVEGRGEFPHDMLRRDDAWPATLADGEAIAATLETGAPRRRVTLKTMERHLTTARWKDFGWDVVEDLPVHNPVAERLAANVAARRMTAKDFDDGGTDAGMVTVPLMIHLKRPPIGQVQDTALLARIETALMREFEGELEEGAGVVAVAVAPGRHEMTRTSPA